MKRALLCLALVGCIDAPVFGLGAMRASAPDPAKVAACTALRHKHNVLATLGVGLGTLSGAGGLAADVSDTGTRGTVEKVAIGGGGALFAVAGATLGAFAGFASDDYAAEQCSTVAQP